MANYGTRDGCVQMGELPAYCPCLKRRMEERVLMGILGIEQDPKIEFDADEKQVLVLLSNRIVLALMNRNLQRKSSRKQGIEPAI